MNLLSNSCQQMSKKSENGKNGPPTNPASAPPKNFIYCCYTTFHWCRQNARKNITVTVSVRVSVTVRVSLVLFVCSNTFGASSVAICRRCVYKILVAFAQRCVYNGDHISRRDGKERRKRKGREWVGSFAHPLLRCFRRLCM